VVATDIAFIYNGLEKRCVACVYGFYVMLQDVFFVECIVSEIAHFSSTTCSL
jgi:hypothetical protein